MPEVLLQILIFVGSLALLVKSSDWFIDASERIGLALGLPSFIVGVTVVATGTSLPELISSIIAVNEGASEIVIGNVVGSNIANICLVLGFVAIMSGKFLLSHNIMRAEVPILLGSAILLFLTAADGIFSIADAIVMLVGLLVMIAFFIWGADKPEEAEDVEHPKLRPLDLLILAASGTGIYFSADFNIGSIIALSGLLGIGTEVIALTAVSIGTSLPELVVSIVAMRRGNHEMVIGNVLGSNVFNTFAVMGIPALFGTLVIPPSVLIVSLPLMLGVTLLFAFIVIDKEVNRWEGLLLFVFYAYFLADIITNAV